MKHYLLGLFDDDDVLLNAVDKVQANNIKIHDVVSPFPVHGLDHKLGGNVVWHMLQFAAYGRKLTPGSGFSGN